MNITNSSRTSSFLRQLAVAALLSVGLVPAISMAQGTNDRVRIQVRAESDSDRQGGDKAGAAAKTTQEKTLHISISGKAKDPETRTGTWTVYGRDLKGKDLEVIDSGEFKLELPASGVQEVTSKKVSTSYTGRSVQGAKGAKGGGKKVDPTGTKYAGYAVIVKDGDKIVGEFADPMGLLAEAKK